MSVRQIYLGEFVEDFERGDGFEIKETRYVPFHGEQREYIIAMVWSDEIDARLFAAAAEMQARIAELEAREKKLIEALTPFAELADIYEKDGYRSPVRVSKHGDKLLTAGHYYRAQAAIVMATTEVKHEGHN